jgi:hypothetical protein
MLAALGLIGTDIWLPWQSILAVINSQLAHELLPTNLLRFAILCGIKANIPELDQGAPHG